MGFHPVLRQATRDLSKWRRCRHAPDNRPTLPLAGDLAGLVITVSVCPNASKTLRLDAPLCDHLGRAADCLSAETHVGPDRKSRISCWRCCRWLGTESNRR